MAEAINEQSKNSEQSKKPQRTKRASQQEMTVYFADSVSNLDSKLMAAFLSWRYGIKKRAETAGEADIIVVAREEEVYQSDFTGKVVLVASDRTLSKALADQVLNVVAEKPTIFIPPTDDAWLVSKLSLVCRVSSSGKLNQILNNMSSVGFDTVQMHELRLQLVDELLSLIKEADYIVVSERSSVLHTITAAIAMSLNKPVIAEAVTPVFAAFADIAVRRREDIIGIVSALAFA